MTRAPAPPHAKNSPRYTFDDLFRICDVERERLAIIGCDHRKRAGEQDSDRARAEWDEAAADREYRAGAMAKICELIAWASDPVIAARLRELAADKADRAAALDAADDGEGESDGGE